MACRHCSGLVPKVRIPNRFTDSYLTCLSRCDAKPKNLDAGGTRLHSQVKTEFLIANWDPGTLWTDFGVRADIIVGLLAKTAFLFPERKFDSHSHMVSRGLTFTTCCRLIYYIK